MGEIGRGVVGAVALLLVGAADAPTANPWLGTWKLRLDDPRARPETLVYRDAGGGAMRMESVESRSVIVTRFDGVPAPDTGSEDGRAVTLAVKATSATSYAWTFSVAGKPRAQGINTLAADRKTFKEVSWGVAEPDRKTTLIYDRQ